MNQVLARAETRTIPSKSTIMSALADQTPQTRALALATKRMKDQPSHCFCSYKHLTLEDLQTMPTEGTLFTTLEHECRKQGIHTHGTVASVIHALDLTLEEVQKLCAPTRDEEGHERESITSGTIADRLIEILDDEDG